MTPQGDFEPLVQDKVTVRTTAEGITWCLSTLKGAGGGTRGPGMVGLRSGSSRPGRGYKLDPCSPSCLHLALMPELAAPSKAGKGELVKGKCLPFAPLGGAISSTRKEFPCQVFIPKPHSDNGVFRSHSNLLQASHKQSFALFFSISSLPQLQNNSRGPFSELPLPTPGTSSPPFGICLISLSLVEEAVQVQRSADRDPGSHNWAGADAPRLCCPPPTYMLQKL